MDAPSPVTTKALIALTSPILVGRNTAGGGLTEEIRKVTSGEKTDGIETALRGFAPKDVADMAGTHGVSLPVDDSTSLVRDPVDNTKQARIDAGVIATGTTRSIIMGDRDVDLGSGGTFAEPPAGSDQLVLVNSSGALAAVASSVVDSSGNVDLGGDLGVQHANTTSVRVRSTSGNFNQAQQLFFEHAGDNANSYRMLRFQGDLSLRYSASYPYSLDDQIVWGYDQSANQLELMSRFSFPAVGDLKFGSPLVLEVNANTGLTIRQTASSSRTSELFFENSVDNVNSWAITRMPDDTLILRHASDQPFGGIVNNFVTFDFAKSSVDIAGGLRNSKEHAQTDIGTQPTPGSNQAGHYAYDSGSGTTEFWTFDEAGNDTVLSPHAKDAPATLYSITPGIEAVVGYWNRYRGDVRWLNLETGASEIETFDAYNSRRGLAPGDRGYRKVQSWMANQDRLEAEQVERQTAWDDTEGAKKQESLDAQAEWDAKRAAAIEKLRAQSAEWRSLPSFLRQNRTPPKLDDIGNRPETYESDLAKRPPDYVRKNAPAETV